jgi:hypothetical protein
MSLALPARPGRTFAAWPFALLVTRSMALPAVAGAAPQDDDISMDEDDEDDEDDDDEEPMELEADHMTPASRPVPAGASETPTAPDAAVGMEQPAVETTTAEQSARPETYPIAVALRPITLYSGMFEVGAGAAMYPSPAAFTTTLRGRYGITDQVEVGLRYAALGVDEGGTVMGKAMAVDVVVEITEWAAAQLSVPVLLEPFAMGFTLGAPLKFRFGDSFALFFGGDLFSYRIKDFVPSVVDPRINAGRTDDVATGTLVSSGNLRLIGGAIYQLEPHMSLSGDFGIAVEFADNEKTDVPLGATFSYTFADLLDLSGRLGFDNIGSGGTFSLTAGLTARL